MKTNTQTKNALGGLRSGLLAKRAKMLAVLALSLTAVSSPAITYDYSYTFGSGLVVSGSLDGDLNGNFVDNVANVSVFFDGTPMSGTVFTMHHAGQGGQFYVNGAIVSFDGSLNNFVFVNSDFVNGDWSYNAFFAMQNFLNSASATAPPATSVDETAVPNRWSLTAQSTSSVPDGGSTVAMLGLTLAGVAGWRRKFGI